jgi:hypothetical protein
MTDFNNLNDERILDFRKPDVKLPKNFPKNRKMILACGDGFRERCDKRMCDKKMCDIEFYTIWSEKRYNIFCCHYSYMPSLNMNINYLNKKRNLNIVICLIDFNNSDEMNRLILLFKNSISYIDTDDIRVYISPDHAYDLLIYNGTANDVRPIKTNGLPVQMFYDEWSNTTKFIETNRFEYKVIKPMQDIEHNDHMQDIVRIKEERTEDIMKARDLQIREPLAEMHLLKKKANGNAAINNTNTNNNNDNVFNIGAATAAALTDSKINKRNPQDPGFFPESQKPKYATWYDWFKDKPTEEWMNRGGKKTKKKFSKKNKKSLVKYLHISSKMKKIKT